MSKKRDRLGSDPLDFMNEGSGDNSEIKNDDVSGSLDAKEELSSVDDLKVGKETGIVNDTGKEIKASGRAAEEKDVENSGKSKKKKGKRKKEKSYNICEGQNVRIIIDDSGSDSAKMKIEGEATIYSVEDIHKCIDKILKSASHLEIDLSGVSRIDTAGFQLILFVKKESDEMSKSVIFKKPSGDIGSIFELYGEKLV